MHEFPLPLPLFGGANHSLYPLKESATDRDLIDGEGRGRGKGQHLASKQNDVFEFMFPCMLPSIAVITQ
jgi:hypothetical protein